MKPPPREPLTAREMRAEAVRIARQWAREFDAQGSPSDRMTASVLRELAVAIARIKLLKPKETDR